MALETPSVAPPAPSAAPTTGDRRRYVVLAVLCLGLLVVGIDGTIVNVALPSLVREIGASSSELQWIVDAYTIIFASFLLIAGNTGDRLGRKGCFVFGLVVFGAGSLLCSLVATPGALILTRGVQGFGAAFIMPATLSILANVFTDPSERARAIALWAGVSGLGVAIGPLAGGFLLENFWWGSIFLVNVPIVVAAIVATLVFVPRSRDEHAPKLDFVGTVLSTTGLLALLYGIIEGPTRGWSDQLIVGAFAGALLLLTAFVFWERHTDHPILDIHFFANPRFTAASVAITLVFFAMFGSLFFISQYLQFVLGYSALESGVGLLPVAAALMIAAPSSAKLVAHVGTKIVVTAGLALVAVALLLFSRVTVTSGYGLIGLVLVIIGVGMGFAMAPATESIMGSLPPEKAGVGSAMNDTTREIGGALGVAIMGSIAAASYSASIVANPAYSQLVKASPAAAQSVKESVGNAAVVAAKLPASVGQAVVAAANDAFVNALDNTVIVAAIVAFLGALVAFFFLPARAGTGREVEQLVDGAALRLLDDPAERRTFAAATLGLLADAGMSSLTYNGIACRSGISTATLEHYWTSRVDAVTDAMREVFEAHPLPDTGDLRRDLDVYVHDVAGLISRPRARQVLGALVAEAGSDVDLARALRERVLGPRRLEVEARLRRARDQLRVPLDAAVDQLFGPVYYRAVIVESPIDDEFLDSVLSSVIARPGVSAAP
jgi:EmrB/QacA subfamily drug resistance transporter